MVSYTIVLENLKKLLYISNLWIIQIVIFKLVTHISRHEKSAFLPYPSQA